MAKTPAWQRAEGKNPKGGLNAKGRAAYNRANPGKPGLKAPQPEGGSRRDSFCARMKGMKKKLTSSKTASDPNSRINKSLRAWNCAEGGMIKKMAKGGFTTAEGRGKPEDLEMARVDRRMSELDKYRKDPNLEMVFNPKTKKFQFREKRKPTPRAEAPVAAAPKKRDTTSNAGTTYKPYRGTGGSSGKGLPLSEYGSSGKKQRAARPTGMKPSTPPPRDMTGVNQTPIRGRDIAGAMAKGGAEGLLMGMGPGALGAGRALLGKVIDKGLKSGLVKNLLTQRGMSSAIARARPGEIVPPSSFIRPRFKSDRANSLRDTPPRLSDTAKEALAKGEITKDEAIRMTLGFKRGGTAKAKPAKVATVMREFKAGQLHSGKSKKIVKNPKQAVAIALSKGRKARKK
jgi:hypothetical protein